MNKKHSLTAIFCILILSLCLAGYENSGISKNYDKADSSVKAASVSPNNTASPNYPDEKYKWILTDTKKDDLINIQNSVDNGHTPKYLYSDQVAMDFVYNNLNLKDKYNGIDVDSSLDKKTVIYTFHLNDGRLLQLLLNKPIKHDSTGIWYVEKYRYIIL